MIRLSKVTKKIFFMELEMKYDIFHGIRILIVLFSLVGCSTVENKDNRKELPPWLPYYEMRANLC